MTTRQFARLVARMNWQHHSLKRTKATLIYRRTGNLRAGQLLLGHTKIESTVRYLGIEVDDALAIAEQMMSDVCSALRQPPLRATSGLMHCSKWAHSISPLARASTVHRCPYSVKM